jgi:hypothetical protein
MAGRRMRLVVSLRPEHAAANAHAFEIDDRLGENRKPRRLRIVRPGLDPATESAPGLKLPIKKGGNVTASGGLLC